jgi:hypothetical protein
MSTLPKGERARLYTREAAAHIDAAATGAIFSGAFEGFRHGGSLERALKTDLRFAQRGQVAAWRLDPGPRPEAVR